MPEISKIQVSGVEYDLKATLPLITVASSQITPGEGKTIITFTTAQATLLEDESIALYKFDVSALGMGIGYMKKDSDIGRPISFTSFGNVVDPPVLMEMLYYPRTSLGESNSEAHGDLYQISFVNESTVSGWGFTKNTGNAIAANGTATRPVYISATDVATPCTYGFGIDSTGPYIESF